MNLNRCPGYYHLSLTLSKVAVLGTDNICLSGGARYWYFSADNRRVQQLSHETHAPANAILLSQLDQDLIYPYMFSYRMFIVYLSGEKFVGEKWRNFYFLTKHLTDEIF